MSDVLLIRGPIEEGTSPWLFARVVDGFGTALTTADVTAGGVNLNVYDQSDGNALIGSFSGLDPNSTYTGHQLMYDTLQTAGWSPDDIGYNLVYLAAWSSLNPGTYGSHVLRFEFTLDLSAALGGGKARANFELPVRPMVSG